MAKRVADVIVETLQAAGVKHCWGVPGDTLNFVTDAIRRSNIEWVHVRHEEVAGFAAGAEAMLTGDLTACAGSCGPGSLHFINGLFESHRNRAPVVLIASQITSDEQGFDFPQEVDFAPIYKSCSVFCDEVRTPAQARRKTAMAAQAALSKRGVAVLILPVDVSKAHAPDEPTFAVHVSQPVIHPGDADLDRIAEVLNAGTRIAVYGGSGCQDAHDQIVALADRLKAPVAHTSRAKDFIEYANPFNVGMTGVIGTAAGYHAVMACDTLLLLGCDFAWRPPSRPPPRQDTGFLDDCVKRHEDAFRRLDKRATVGRGGAIHPQYLAHLIDQHAADDAVFTADGGECMVWALRHIRATGRRRTILSLTHGTMANAMPQALGAKKAAPNRQVISLSGDGGLSMLLGDLITAVQENIPIKIAVFNNSSLGFVELEMKVEGLLDAYTNLENPDFARVAQAMGFHAQRVEQAEDLEAAVRDWIAAPGPALLDVVTDRMELVIPPKIEIAQVFGTALYSAKAVLSGRTGDVWELVTDNLA
jgi:pyruvate dehydrogenase (quinone)